MVVLSTKLIVKRKKGPTVDLRRALKQTMFRVGERISKLGMEAAKANYLTRRKTKKTPSLIWGDFTYDGTVSTGVGSVISSVFCGGPQSDAYYAYYVDVGHTLRNGVWWPGYRFAKVGIRKSKQEFPRIAKIEVRKLKNISII